jgi:predicted GIY-YIG superfamily endonuclease
MKMYYVYLLRSKSDPKRTYVGFTENLERRLEEHNEGFSKYTKSYIPWELEVSIGFSNKQKAKDFEIYLKQGSGYAFARKHFWNSNP